MAPPSGSGLRTASLPEKVGCSAGVVPSRVTTKIATDLQVLTGEGVRLSDNRVDVATIR
jgi:hypothetical protein